MSLIRIYYHGGEDDRMALEGLEFHPELLEMLHDAGIVEIRGGFIGRGQLQRIYKLMRLRSGMGVNLPGAAIILDLLDRIEDLQAEVERLKRGR